MERETIFLAKLHLSPKTHPRFRFIFIRWLLVSRPKMVVKQHVKLNTGAQMPVLGFGMSPTIEHPDDPVIFIRIFRAAKDISADIACVGGQGPGNLLQKRSEMR